ncbi:MAG: SpoIIIAH-like family protein [Clostridia bacterium]|jgi:stage III sporulation protein AH|nr:SpoIIIAH-like family protein [Clostridia bacterium]
MTIITNRNTVIVALCVLALVFLYLSFTQKPVESLGGEEELNRETLAEQAMAVPEAPEREQETIKEQPGGDEFFMEYRLERDRRRAQEIELLQSMINSGDEGSDIKQEVQYKLLAITNSIDQELTLEALIMARGYADAVAVVQPESVTVVVRSGDFTEEDAARIADLVTRTTGISLAKVTVFARE